MSRDRRDESLRQGQRADLRRATPSSPPTLSTLVPTLSVQVKASLWWDEAEGGPFCDDEDEQQGWMRLINSLSLPSRSSLCLGHQ